LFARSWANPTGRRQCRGRAVSYPKSNGQSWPGKVGRALLSSRDSIAECGLRIALAARTRLPSSRDFSPRNQVSDRVSPCHQRLTHHAQPAVSSLKNIKTSRPLLLVLLLLAAPAAVQAQFTYTTDAGAITTRWLHRAWGSVANPATINGLPVSSIGTNAFVTHGLTPTTQKVSIVSIPRAGRLAGGNDPTLVSNRGFSQSCNIVDYQGFVKVSLESTDTGTGFILLLPPQF